VRRAPRGKLEKGAKKKRAPRCRCYGNDHRVIHVKGCRRGRPECKWMRKTNPRRRPCRCSAYPFPHRDGGGACGSADDMPAVLVRDLARRRREGHAAE
jgi:hypothetical protein